MYDSVSQRQIVPCSLQIAYIALLFIAIFMLIAVPKFAITFSQSEAVSNVLKSHDIKLLA